MMTSSDKVPGGEVAGEREGWVLGKSRRGEIIKVRACCVANGCRPGQMISNFDV